MIRHSWRTQLKAAAREKDVLAVVRGYLAEWSQGEIAQLPPGAWPARISGRADILAHAALLAGVHARFDGSPSALPGLQEMLLFFTHAAVRTAKLGSAAETADPPANGRATADPPRNGRGSVDPPRRVRTKAARKRRSNGRRVGSARRG
jgi:hypothetical protein